LNQTMQSDIVDIRASLHSQFSVIYRPSIYSNLSPTLIITRTL
jgi:hypothetical protein